jgi:hypothetical protein
MTTVTTYECRKCGARFGIAGENSGSDEDYAADDYYASEVERHESGECVSPARRRWLSLRRTPRRRHGVLVPWSPAAPTPRPVLTVRQRHDSTRAKRARRDREAMSA